MAKAEAADNPDGENEVVSSPKTQPANGKKVSMAPEDDQSEKQNDDASDTGSAEGSEYEIESIVNAKRNASVCFSPCSFLDGCRGHVVRVSSVTDAY